MLLLLQQQISDAAGRHHPSAPPVPSACTPHAGGVKLESLLKLNDVKVTLAAGPAGPVPARKHSSHEQAGGSVTAANEATAAATAGAAAAESALPPVKTLLEFVAWVALQQEAEAAGGGRASRGGAEHAARAAKAGFLAQQLPELALAVRRMQTGG